MNASEQQPQQQIVQMQQQPIQQQMPNEQPYPGNEIVTSDIVEHKENVDVQMNAVMTTPNLSSQTIPRRTSSELLTAEANVAIPQQLPLTTPPVSSVVNASPAVPTSDTGTPNSTLSRLSTQNSTDKIDR